MKKDDAPGGELRVDLWFESGEQSLEVRHLSVREAISSHFTVSVLARSKHPAIDLESIVGKGASLTLSYGAEPVRIWQGVCSHIEQTHAMPPDEPLSLSTYELEIVPVLWLLGHRSGHRIYQHLSIPDIVTALLGEWGLHATWQIDRGSYPKLEYKVQHGESDYDFVCRLLEEAGIAFTFPDHEGTATTLTLGDNLSGAAARPAIPYGDNVNWLGREGIKEVRLLHRVRPGKVTQRDHDFRNPGYPLFGKAVPEAHPPENRYEQYRYDAGAFLAKGAGGGETPVADSKGIYRPEEKRGGNLATRTLQALRADKRAVAFRTNVAKLAPGMIFSIEGHHHPEIQSGKLLVTEFAISGAVEDDWIIEGTAIFADPAAPYRPQRKTPRPVVFGLQSATVVGPRGVEIHADEFGRVRVQFPWDREGKHDDDGSCWLRVSQGWAGAGFGMITLPRVGQEVLVAFLDGDPDMPIIAGRAFNGREVVPYKLPDHQTVSTWKSSSSPHTGGYNEIKFEDKAGQELVYLQAERDRNQLVKRDDVERTERDRRATVGRDEDVVVKGGRKQLVHKADHLHVKLDQHQKVGGSMSLTVGMNRDEKAGMNHAIEAGANIHVKAGATLVLEAGARITLKAAGGFIDIHAGGIDIVGVLVKINSGGAPGMGSGAHPIAPLDAEEAHPKDTPS